MMSIISRHGPACGLHLRFASLNAPSLGRRIHLTPLASMSVKEKMTQVADKVNKKVGEGLASAIETGEKATEKTKKTLGATTKRASEDKARAKEGAERIGHKVKEGALSNKDSGKDAQT